MLLRTRIPVLRLSAVLAGVLSAVLKLRAADGVLDPSFGTGGAVKLQVSGFELAGDVLVQPDGKIVAVGESDLHLALVRCNPNGSLDTAFGSGGIVIADGPKVTRTAGYGMPPQVALQPDNKLVVSGSLIPAGSPIGLPNLNVMVLRFKTDGSPDTSFGTGGIASIPFGKDSQNVDIHFAVCDLKIQPDGKILVGGIGDRDDASFAMLRLNADGTPDQGFGTSGRVMKNPTQLANPGSFIANGLHGMTLQPDGKIVAVGGNDYEILNKFRGEFIAMRFNADGTLDSGFDTDGLASILFNPLSASLSALALDAAIQTDGKILLGGYTFTPATGNERPAKKCALARFNADGSPDTSFDGDGMVTLDPGGFSEFRSVRVQADGKIVAFGSRNLATGTEDFVAARFNANGSPDAGFGSGGQLSTDFFGRRDQVFAGVLQADGKPLAAGMATTVNEGRNFAFARYNTNGAPDTSFGTAGKTDKTIESHPVVLHKAAVQPDGRIVAGGETGNGFVLARYLQNGMLDPAFGLSGSMTQSFDNLLNMGGSSIVPPELSVALHVLRVQQDGKIFLAGDSGAGAPLTPLHFLYARLTAAGVPDPGFHQDGTMMTLENGGNYTDSREGLYDAVVRPDGKFITSGLIRYGGSDYTVTNFIRGYKADGSGDNFGFTDTQSGGALAYTYSHLALQADGKVLAAGGNRVTRLNHNGRTDLCFGVGGYTDLSAGPGTMGLGPVAVQTDGRIVAAGTVRTGTGANAVYDVGVVRLMSNGAIDSNFGTGGKTITGVSNEDIVFSIALSTDGKILTGGYRTFPAPTGGYGMLLARFNPDGTLDGSFGSGGFASEDFGFSYNNQAGALALQSDGKIMAAGGALARFTAGSSPVTLPSVPVPLASDLGVTVSRFPEPVETGALITFNATVKNAGTTDATLVTLGESFTEVNAGGVTLPPNFTIESATASQGTSVIYATQVIFSLGNLAPGASATATVKVRPRDTGGLRNFLHVHSCDQIDSNYTDNQVISGTTVQPPQPLAVTFLNTAAGRPVLSVIEGNTGDTPLLFPVILTGVSTQTVTVNYNTLCDNACYPYNFDKTTGTLTFAPGETLKVISVPVHGNTASEVSASRTYRYFTVMLQNPVNAIIGNFPYARGQIYDDDFSALFVTAHAPFSAETGSELTYTLHYSSGSGAQTGVVINDPLPPDTEFVSADNGGSFINGAVVFNVGDLAANGPIGTVSFKVRITGGAGALVTNTGFTIKATGVNPVIGDEISTRVTGPPPVTGPPFAITSIVRNPSTKALTITWNSEAGKNYSIEYSTGLNAWTKIAQAIAGQAGSTSYLDDVIARTAANGGYYRVTSP